MARVHALIGQVAPTDATVLITGESGTGKELAAIEIHAASQRRDKPLVSLDCSTLSPGLLESELFGHVKGAFTGAVATKPGLFRLPPRGVPRRGLEPEPRDPGQVAASAGNGRDQAGRRRHDTARRHPPDRRD
jgi:hypothetical protein